MSLNKFKIFEIKEKKSKSDKSKSNKPISDKSKSTFPTQPSALTIAGSDPSGGAGIQADLKAFDICGVHGASVITCVTAQNTKGVQMIEPLSKKVIYAQLESVLNDLKPIAIKTGMLYSAEIVDTITNRLKTYQELTTTRGEKQMFNLVVDPVMLATTGMELTNGPETLNKFIDTLKNSLFPLATIITPNIPEAEIILGWNIKTQDDMKRACEELRKFGSKYVLLKGGHLLKENENNNISTEAVDILYNGNFQTYKKSRHLKDVHGTGCTFAALITGYLAKGFNVSQAVKNAKELITKGIERSVTVGEGVEVVNISKIAINGSEQSKIQSQITHVAEELTKILDPHLMPEVGVNIGFAFSDARIPQDVCALTGRLVRVGREVRYLGKAEFGASKHVARVILTAMKEDNSIRSAMNIKYRPEIIELCDKLKFSIGTFNRNQEPKDISSMEWGTKTAIKSLGYVPDVIYDIGGVGKEPMIRILGKNPQDVLGKVKKIIIEFNNSH